MAFLLARDACHPLAQRPGHIFWLINLALLLLSDWTLTETASIVVQVDDGRCTAILPDRTSSIPCPEIDDSQAGLYLNQKPAALPGDFGPLDWLAPGAAWQSIWLTSPSNTHQRAQIVFAENMPGCGEWRIR